MLFPWKYQTNRKNAGNTNFKKEKEYKQKNNWNGKEGITLDAEEI